MAITLSVNQPAKSGFSVNGYTADATGNEELYAAPGAGKSIVLSQLFVDNPDGVGWSIGSNADNTQTTLSAINIGPITSSAFGYIGREPIKLPENTSLMIDATGAGALTIVVEGYVE